MVNEEVDLYQRCSALHVLLVDSIIKYMEDTSGLFAIISLHPPHQPGSSDRICSSPGHRFDCPYRRYVRLSDRTWSGTCPGRSAASSGPVKYNGSIRKCGFQGVRKRKA